MWYRFFFLLFILGALLLASWVYLAVIQGDVPAVISEALSNDDQRYYRQRELWRAVDSTLPNISATVYNDVNRNGIYDTGDRPMMRVAVRLHRPDGSNVVRHTNMRGFANFTNSLTASPVSVSEPGEYQYEVLVPHGWVVTSGNRTQTGNYEERRDARPGIVVDRVPQPVGLAPELFIHGRVVVQDDNEFKAVADAVLMAVSPEGDEHDIQVDDGGYFHLDAEPGIWSLRARSEAIRVDLEREVEVIQTPVQLSTMVLGADEPLPLDTEYSVDFEEVTRARMIKIPNDPGGLHWINFIVLENEFYNGEGYINNTVSGRYLAYNTSGHPTYIEREGGFDFVGAYFGVAWLRAEGEYLDIRAWRGNELVGEDSFQLSALGPVWFEADYRNITRLEIATRHYWQFVIDNPVFRLPEPEN